MRVLLPTHNASVHRILKLLPSITLCRIQHSLSFRNLSLRIGFFNLQPKRSSKFHPPGKGLAFCPEYVCSDITGFSGLHLCLHYVFYCHQMNQRHYIYVISSLECLLFCTCWWPFHNVKVVCILGSLLWEKKL